MTLPDGQLEWLESNAQGSFCFGSVDRRLRRKYHALLTVRNPGRGDPWNVLSELLETVEVEGQTIQLGDPLARHRPHAELRTFRAYPHATHVYSLLYDGELERTVRMGEHDQVEITYRVRNVFTPLKLKVTPLLRCRPIHELTQENPFLDGSCMAIGDEIRLMPYLGMPSVAMQMHGPSAHFEERGMWLPSPVLKTEVARGYPANESLFAPGEWTVELSTDSQVTFVVALAHCEPPGRAVEHYASAAPNFAAKLERAAAQFVMRDNDGAPAVVAGYPWFGNYARDTLMALPGLYLATSDYHRCEAILESLAKQRKDGLIRALPGPRETGSVEASLQFARAVQWFALKLGEPRIARFMPVVLELLDALAEGQDPRVRLDRGIGVFTQPGPHALTWMNAVVDAIPVTPRTGYAVDLDALAYNAAHFACEWADSHRPQFARAFRTRLRGAEADFMARYWDDTRGYLADSHNGWRADTSLRPNQLWALALPYRPAHGPIARSALAAVTRELLVPMGLRTLSPRDPSYAGHYRGSQKARDKAYHQGSAWPALLGIYADAVLAQHGPDALSAQLDPILSRLAQHIDGEGCIGQISELFDGDAPHTANGAPAHAISACELLRAFRLLHDSESRGTARTQQRSAEEAHVLTTYNPRETSPK